MSMEIIILGFLMSGAKSGYKLQSIANHMMPFITVSHNQVYPALRKLERGGYVEKRVVIQSGKPNKNLFSLTEPGREYFFMILRDDPVPLDVTLPFLLRNFFFRFLDEHEPEKELEKEIRALTEQYEKLRSVASVVKEHADEHGEFIFRTAVYMIGALKDWYQQELNNRKNKGR